MSKKPKSPEQALAFARAAAKEGRIELAEQDYIQKYEKEIDQILKTVGHPDALVTDESCMTDFCEYDFTRNTSDEERKRRREKLVLAFLKKISKKLGLPVGKDDYVWQVAVKLRKANLN